MESRDWFEATTPFSCIFRVDSSSVRVRVGKERLVEVGGGQIWFDRWLNRRRGKKIGERRKGEKNGGKISWVLCSGLENRIYTLFDFLE